MGDGAEEGIEGINNKREMGEGFDDKQDWSLLMPQDWTILKFVIKYEGKVLGSDFKSGSAHL